MESNQILEVVNSALIGIVGFFLLRLIKTIDALGESHTKLSQDFNGRMMLVEHEISQNTDAIKTIRNIENKLLKMEHDIETAIQFANEMKGFKEEFAVMKRDQNAIWRKIDEGFKLVADKDSDIELMRKRIHFLINKIMIIRNKAEKAGWEFKDDWGIEQ